ncbi:MAG: flagellar biosynthetic protein FliO [Candidatus Binatia bacterium]
MNPVTLAGPPEIAWPAIAAVVLLTVGATLVHWWLKRRGLVPTTVNPIKVVALRSLGGKRSVAVVEVESQRFLLGLTDESVSCLSQLTSAAHPVAAGPMLTLSTATGR